MTNEGRAELGSMNPAELTAYFEKLGLPAYRARQVFSWIHRGVQSFEQMTDLPLALRQELAQKTRLPVPGIAKRQRSEADGTVKILADFGDVTAECVLMRYEHGNTACISCQAGCRMGCAFCASGLLGLERNLTPGEMLGQVLLLNREEARVNNIVLMGTGEPLDNLPGVLKFLSLVGDPLGLNIGQRHISLSTCGLADKIDELAEHKLQITLSISLHAPFDDMREKLMPVSKAYPLEKLMASCKRYFERTGRRISYEYAMIDGVNDTPACADALARLLRGAPAHVNLIPLNPVTESGLRASPRARVEEFRSRLEKRRIGVTVRRRLGPDIDAACGQLRSGARTVKRQEGTQK